MRINKFTQFIKRTTKVLGSQSYFKKSYCNRGGLSCRTATTSNQFLSLLIPYVGRKFKPALHSKYNALICETTDRECIYVYIYIYI